MKPYFDKMNDNLQEQIKVKYNKTDKKVWMQLSNMQE